MNSRKFIFIAVGVVVGLLSIPAVPFILIVGMTAYGEFDEWRHQEPEEFSERKWKSNKKYRWVSVDLLIEEQLNQKMKKEEVIALLGQPDETTLEGHFEYDADRPGWQIIDFSGGGLLLKFTPQGYLESSINTTWID